jgi:aminoglycoside phosphotransferase (APT) family kinase protein
MASHFGTPKAEIQITNEMVHDLVKRQHPDLADLELVHMDSGFDNVTYRIGKDLAVRLPRRESAAALIVHEQEWLPVLSPNLPLKVPVPVRMGSPQGDYPWRWSITPWYEGETADVATPLESEAEVFGSFLSALHAPAPENAPENPFRGCPLRARQDAIESRLDRLSQLTDALTPSHFQIWQKALSTEIDVEPTWIHGDLHGRNVLVQEGRLAAILDWGDLTSGDRATDLAGFWMLFDNVENRRSGLKKAGVVSEATLIRAMGWALSFGVLLLDTGLGDQPAHENMGRDILRRLDDEVLG